MFCNKHIWGNGYCVKGYGCVSEVTKLVWALQIFKSLWITQTAPFYTHRSADCVCLCVCVRWLVPGLTERSPSGPSVEVLRSGQLTSISLFDRCGSDDPQGKHNTLKNLSQTSFSTYAHAHTYTHIYTHINTYPQWTTDWCIYTKNTRNFAHMPMHTPPHPHIYTHSLTKG